MKISNRQQLLALVAGVALALLFGDKLVLSPLLRSWKERTAHIARLRHDIAQGTLLLDREQTIRERWESMRTNTLPENISAAESEVLQAFEHWSQVSQISIANFKPQWRETDENYLTLECRADAYGSMDALTRFLYNVERDPLALRIEAIEIAARDNNGAQLSLGLQVSGVTLKAQP
jgi:hypothetical protein